MARQGVLISSIFISTIFNIIYGYPGSTQLHRVARSPHYGGFGFPPPPPFPIFQTNNWSGITKSADGNAHGVYSGAAARASNSGPASGQALSLASADCDDEGSVQSTGPSGKLITGFGDGNSGSISGGFGGFFGGYKKAHYSYQSGGGNIEGSGLNSQSTTESQGRFNYGASNSPSGHFGANGQIKQNELSSSNQNHVQASTLGGADQAGGFSSSNAGSLSFGKDNGHQQEALNSGNLKSENDNCENQEHENLHSSVNAGFDQENNGNKHNEFGGLNQKKEQKYEHSHLALDTHGGRLSQYGDGLNHQITNSYGQQTHLDGELGQQKKQLSDFGQHQAESSQQIGQHVGFDHGGYGQQTQQSGYGQQQGQASAEKQNQAAFGQDAFAQHQGQRGFDEHQLSHGQQFNQNLGGKGASSQASAYGHGGGFGYGTGFSGYGQHNHKYGSDFNSKYQVNQDLQQQQSGAELNSGNSESHSAGSQGSSAIGGALNLASQSLDAAQKADCSTCGNGGYAFSNAKSHSGSAISVAIGG